ncbi:MAG TPA: hypothetical protein VLV49_14895 [Terriglobales bacterium]|nr:hypothetical protein [Terriglobales bacterium]
MLPVLVVLFLVSYGLMAMLVVEQGRTITVQRNLIHELFRDTATLNALRSHEMHHPVTPRSQAHAPLSQTPSTPFAQVDPTQKHPGTVPPQQEAGSKRNSQKFQRQAPLRPPKMTSDEADVRRATNLI